MAHPILEHRVQYSLGNATSLLSSYSFPLRIPVFSYKSLGLYWLQSRPPLKRYYISLMSRGCLSTPPSFLTSNKSPCKSFAYAYVRLFPPRLHGYSLFSPCQSGGISFSFFTSYKRPRPVKGALAYGPEPLPQM